MKRVCLYLFLVVSNSLFPQNKNPEFEALDIQKDSLRIIIKNLYTSTNDDDKHKYNQQLLDKFAYVLKMPGSFVYPFDSLTDIGILSSTDKMLRIFNWNVPLNDGTHEYYGFLYHKQIQVKKVGMFKKAFTETYKVFPLKDASKNITAPDNYISDNNKWYGMLYYSIITKKMKNNKISYTLLGWDGNDKFSKKKIIDVLTFDNKGNPVFGGSIFNTLKGTKKRIIFEYDANCTMSLKYNPSKDSIIFDHLVPTQPQLEGQYQYYCTDFTYDGFGFKNGKWNYKEFVHATNEKAERDKFYKDPKTEKDAIKSNEVIKRKKQGKKE